MWNSGISNVKYQLPVVTSKYILSTSKRHIMSPHEKNLIMHTTYFYCYMNRVQEFISIRALFKRGMHYNVTAIINYDTSVIYNVINNKRHHTAGTVPKYNRKL